MASRLPPSGNAANLTTPSARTGVVIFESNDVAAVQRYIGQWNAYCDIDLAPVLDDEEATTVGRQIIADNNA